MKLEQAKPQILPGVVTPSKKQVTVSRAPVTAQPATPAQLQRAKNRLEQDQAQLQRQAEQASLQREARERLETQARVQHLQDQVAAQEQQIKVQRLADTQARQQTFFSSFIKSPAGQKSQQQVKTSSIQAAQARDQYQAAIEPEILQRLVDDSMTLQAQKARASQAPNELSARAEWFNSELPVLRAKHNHPDTPFLDSASVFKPADQQAFALGKTYGIQRLSSGLTPKDAASAILNIQRKADRDLALRGLLTGINPRQSDYTSIQRLVNEGETNLELQRTALLEDPAMQSQALQLASAEAHPTSPNSGISDRIKAKFGGGDPLPENVRQQLEMGLNADLSSVRVHTDGEADFLSKSVQAKAFTTGNHIFFSSGAFDPNTKWGYELVAHEATHTFQQASGQVQPGIDTDHSLEIAAQTKGAELAAKFDPNFKFKNLENQAQPNSPLIASQPPAHRMRIQAMQRSSVPQHQPLQREPQAPTPVAPVSVSLDETALATLTTSLLTVVPQKYQTDAQNNIPVILRQCFSSQIKNANQVAYILATAQHESRFGAKMYSRSESLVEDHNPLQIEHKKVTNKKTKKTHVEDIPYRSNHVTGHRINADPKDTNNLDTYYDDAYGGRLGNVAGSSDGANYRGRGFVQITGRDNYKRLGTQIQNEGFNYTFDGITYGTKEHPIDLEANPTHVNLVPELAAKIMVSGMQNDSFAQHGHGLSTYVNDKNTDFKGARALVNGSDRDSDIAKIAQDFAKILNANNAWSNLFVAPDLTKQAPDAAKPSANPNQTMQRSSLGLQRETTTSNPSTQPTSQHAEGNALRTFNLSNFTNKQVIADVEFGSSLEKINAIAIKNKVKLYVTSSFRSTSNVGGAIVTPAKKSNHMAGHAIDINIMWGPGYKNFANGDVMASPNAPAPVKAFIDDMEAAGFRWGQRFPQADPVHFDDGLNVNDPKRWIERYKATHLPGGSQPYKPAPSSDPSTQPVQRARVTASSSSSLVIQASREINVPIRNQPSQAFNNPKSVHLQRLRSANITLQRDPTPQVRFAQVGFVRDDGLNLRAEPSQTSNSLAKMPVGTRVVVSAIENGWFKVLTPFGTGFVAASDDHVHFAPAGYLEQDPGLQMVRVRNGETGMGLVNRMYGNLGTGGSKDQNIWHFLNAIRKINKPEAFASRDLGLLDNIQNAVISGADANNIVLKAGVDLWIPSFQAAARMDVGSGTVRGELARLEKKVSQKIEDFKTICRLATKYTPQAVTDALGQTAGGLITGLLTFARDAVIIVGGSTAIGALIGALFGGVGAAPGAALGFEVGLQILEIWGLKFLLEWIWNAGQQFVDMVGSYGNSLNLLWDANGDQAKLDQSAQLFAHATAQLSSLLLQAIAAYALHKGTKAILESKFAAKVGKTHLGQWINERVLNQQTRRNQAVNNTVSRVTGKAEFDIVADSILRNIPEEQKPYFRQALGERIQRSGQTPTEFSTRLGKSPKTIEAIQKRAAELELNAVLDAVLKNIPSEQQFAYRQALTERINSSGKTPTQFAKDLQGSKKTIQAIQERAAQIELNAVLDSLVKKIPPDQQGAYRQAIAERIQSSGKTPSQFAKDLQGSKKTIQAIQERAAQIELSNILDIVLKDIPNNRQFAYRRALTEQINSSGKTPTQFAKDLKGSKKTIKAIQERAAQIELNAVLDSLVKKIPSDQQAAYRQAITERIQSSGKSPVEFASALKNSPETVKAIQQRANELLGERPSTNTPTASASHTALEQIRNQLSDEAKLLFDADRVKAGSDDAFLEQLTNQKGDPVKRYEGEARNRAGAEQKKKESEQRIQGAYNQITGNSAFMNSKEMQHALGQTEFPATRSAIATELVRAKVEGEFSTANGYKVMVEVKIIQEIPGFASRQEWVNANPGKSPKQIIELNGKIYKPITDIDVLAAKDLGNGKFEIVHMEQIKSGKSDQPIRAQEQNQAAMRALEQLKSGDQAIRILKDGDITSQFSFEHLKDIEAVTRGPAEKIGFDRSIGLNSQELEGLAKKIHQDFRSR